MAMRMSFRKGTLAVLALIAIVNGQEKTCENAADPTCEAPSASDHLGQDFLYPPLKVGEVSPLLWRDDKKPVADYTVRVGLPPELRKELLTYADETGMTDHFWNLTYDDPLKPGTIKFLPDVKRGDTKGMWTAKRPNKKWRSNMHWIQPGDEQAHEDSLKVMAAGNFDVVLAALGKYFNLDGIMVQGLGIVGVSHCTRGFVHHDMSGTGGKFFNILIPLINAEDADPELILVDDSEEEERRGTIKYEYNVGIVVGDDGLHGTQACDYRDKKGMRMTATIYFADVNEENAEIISYDDTSIFPVPGHEKWTLAQKGRHWGGGNSLVSDPGRKPIKFKDKWKECPKWAEEGYCESDPFETRLHCLKSCNVFVSNEDIKSEA